MNKLSKETSPYLLQHQNNPVDWLPWGEAALEKAKTENKLILVSIGYSACHWCHVMEKECFEDAEVAALMNQHFVNIKVDREERPDVDQLYMEAVQLMNRQGGWPLNCFALPDGKPFFGGTYFPKEKWMGLLRQIAELYQNEPKRITSYANDLTHKIEAGISFYTSSEKTPDAILLESGVSRWKNQFDPIHGGTNRAPKFPLPSSWSFLLQYGVAFKEDQLINHVVFTLEKMARGGIYDQLGGGFARYSVDEYWKVPHFEKMLYDNAQLIGLYAEAFAFTQKNEFRHVVEQSVQFCLDELYHSEKGFYCALDADSEGVEGKYYVWSESELEELLGDNLQLARRYYQLHLDELWEGNFILARERSYEEFAKQEGYNEQELLRRLENIHKALWSKRKSRIKPGLDNKVLTSWNALMVTGLCKAYKHLKNDLYLDLAKKTMMSLLNQHVKDEIHLFRSVSNHKVIHGFLDDYAITIEALIQLFEVDHHEFWIQKAKFFQDVVFDLFYDRNTELFLYNSTFQKDIVANKVDMTDDVIPSAASVTAHNLHALSLIYNNTYYMDVCKSLVSKIIDRIPEEIAFYTNWARLLNKFTPEFSEIVITGKEAKHYATQLQSSFRSNVLIVASTTDSALPIFKNRFNEKETAIFVCRNSSCLPPVYNLEDAMEIIK